MIKKRSTILILFAAVCVLFLSSNCTKKETDATDAKKVNPSDIYNLANVEGPENVKKIIKEEILNWINDPIIVNAVKSENSKNAERTEKQIIKLDYQWKNFKSIPEFVKNMITNEVTMFLKEKQNESNGKIAEIFVMDNQGCNVGLSTITSDYWQGDEDKFKLSYNNGNGGVFIDKSKFDISTQVTLIQVSLPIIDPKDNKVIGAITVGLAADNLK